MDDGARPRPSLRRAGTWAVRAVSGAVWVALAAWGGYQLAMRHGLEALQQAAAQRLEITAARLDAQLARFDFLPSLLETSPEVMRFLDSPADPELGRSVNLYLQSLNAIAGAENLYVVGRDGMTLAAADFASPGTPLGRDLSYRPYVRDALEFGRGRFYGVGVTSALAGYYLSYALPAHGKPRGLAAVKVNLTQIEHDWREVPGEVLVVDEHRVAILSTREDWRYRPLEPLADATRAEVAQARRYGTSALVPLQWHLYPAGERAPQGALQQVRADKVSYVASVRAVHGGRWQLILLDDESAVRANARTVAFSAALGAAIALLLLALLVVRQRASRQRLASRVALQEAHDQLERKVVARTDALRAAQDELVHAGKLAALGQMSAGMVHELNQPLAALQTVSDNTAQLIQLRRLDEALDNLARIGRLVGRLKRLSGQLRLFAYKSVGVPGMVSVRKLVAEVEQQLAGRLQDEGVALVAHIEPETLAVAGDEARLEQVLANLLGNALDALRSTEGPRRIDIEARALDGVARVAIRNNGPLIDQSILTRMFQPFVTSKPAGKGLGLGLMISAHIVREFGGSLRARNLAPTGAEFVIELPGRRDTPKDAAET